MNSITERDLRSNRALRVCGRLVEEARYSLEAYSDNRFRFSTDSKIKGIVDGLKSHSWPQQEPAVRSVNEIDFQTASGNELFVLGRNI